MTQMPPNNPILAKFVKKWHLDFAQPHKNCQEPILGDLRPKRKNTVLWLARRHYGGGGLRCGPRSVSRYFKQPQSHPKISSPGKCGMGLQMTTAGSQDGLGEAHISARGVRCNSAHGPVKNWTQQCKKPCKKMHNFAERNLEELQFFPKSLR